MFDPDAQLRQFNQQANQNIPAMTQGMLGQPMPTMSMPSQPSSADTQAAQDALNQAQQAPQQNQTPPKSGWSWLSTAGSILAPIAGALLAPETGGLSLLAESALSGLGAAGGEAASQALNKQPVNLGQDVATGLTTGGLNLATGGLLKGIGKLGGALQESGVAKQAANMASPTLTDAQQALRNAQLTKANYGVIPPRLQAKMGLGNAQEFTNQFGLDGTDPAQMNQVGQAGLDINRELNGLIGDQTVDASGARKNISNLIINGLKGQPILNAKTPLEAVFKQAGTDTSALSKNASVADLRNMQQAIGRQQVKLADQINAAHENGFITQENALTDQHAQLDQAKQAIEDVIYKNNQPLNDAVAGYTVPADLKAQWTNKYGQPLADKMESILNGAQTGKELSSAMAPFAQAGNISKLALRDLQATGTPRAELRAKLAMEAETQPQKPAESLFDKAMAAGSLFEGTVGNHPLALLAGPGLKAASKLAQSPEAQIQAGGILSSISKNKLANTLAKLGARTVGTAPAYTGSNQGGNQVNFQAPDITQSLPYQEVMLGLMAPSFYGNNLGQATKQLSSLESGVSAAQNLANYYNQAGGGAGGIGGLLNTIGGYMTGGPSASYNPQRAMAQAQLANALTTLTGNQVAPQSIATPSLLSTQGAAQQSLNNIQNLLGAFKGYQGTGMGQ